MSQKVNLFRRNFLTAREVRSTIVDTAQTFRLDLADRCLPFQNVVCEVCRDTCEVNAIRFPPKLGAAASPVIDADRCTGCGECVSVCPVNALSIEEINAHSIGAIDDCA